MLSRYGNMWVHAIGNAAAWAAAGVGSKCRQSLSNTDERIWSLVSGIFHMGISENGYQHGQERGLEIDLNSLSKGQLICT